MKLLLFLLFTVTCTAADLAPMHVKNLKLDPDQFEKTDAKVYSRHIYMKLPLLQPRFHWVFTDKKKFLSGSLTLTIESEMGKLEVPIFAEGVISRNWEVMNCGGRGKHEDNIYFGFTSKKPYKVSETDKVYLSLKVNDDIQGIGADIKGIFKPGTYTSNSKFKLYHLEEHIGEKDVYAFLNTKDWEVLWKLVQTDDKGWMEEKFNKESRLKLDSHKSVYNFELDFGEDEKMTLSVVNHKKKEYFFEHFNNVDDLVKYLKDNNEHIPDEIKCANYPSETSKGFIKKCHKIEEEIMPVKFTYSKEPSVLQEVNTKENIHFMSKYSRRKE